MLLIPIGRDDAEIRRHAWVSYAILALNALVFVLTIVATRPSVLESLSNQWQAAYVFYVQRPYLKPPGELVELLPDGAKAQISARMRGLPLPSQKIIEQEQRQLDEMVARAVAARDELPNQRFGYVPSEPSAYKLFTSMFLHAGILHLLGNLLFFYLSGPFIEDVFGRPLFAVLYFVGGVVAALTFAARDPNGVIPLVGASGAISAVMGAYLFRFYRSKIELLFVPFLWRPMLHWRFFLPAFVVLPLWFGEQLIEMRSEEGSGVAFSAHVGGFVFGFVFAAVLSLIKFEQKFVEPLVTKQTTWVMDDRLARAIAARQRGDDMVAKKELASVLRDEPRNIDALRTALDMAEAEDDWSNGDGIAARLLNAYIEEKHLDTAKNLIGDITANREARLPKFLARAAAFVERTGDRDWALMLYERLYDADPVGPGAVGTLVKTSALLRASGEPAKAREMLQKARAHPACNSDWAHTIESKLQ
jgi:membrane associated rhomboid family serine protease